MILMSAGRYRQKQVNDKCQMLSILSSLQSVGLLFSRADTPTIKMSAVPPPLLSKESGLSLVSIFPFHYYPSSFLSKKKDVIDAGIDRVRTEPNKTTQLLTELTVMLTMGLLPLPPKTAFYCFFQIVLFQIMMRFSQHSSLVIFLIFWPILSRHQKIVLYGFFLPLILSDCLTSDYHSIFQRLAFYLANALATVDQYSRLSYGDVPIKFAELLSVMIMVSSLFTLHSPCSPCFRRFSLLRSFHSFSTEWPFCPK